TYAPDDVVAVGPAWGESRPDAPWAAAPMIWRTLPGRTPVRLPYDFAIPEQPWVYAAEARPFDRRAQAERSLLRVQVTVQAGAAGVAIASPDGSRLLSAETIVTAKQGPTTVYLPVP